MEWSLYPISAFDKFAEQWDALNLSCGNSPLLSSDFVIPLLKNFSTGRELLAICIDSGIPVSMAVVNKLKPGSWTTFQPSQAPIGLWVQLQDLPLEQLASELRKALPGLVVVFSVTQQDPDLLPRPADSNRLTTLDYIETARITVKGTFDEYWSQRGKNLRQNLRRQRSRLSRENTDVALRIITEKNQVYDCVKAYGELESSGWKAGENTAIHIDNDQGHFYLELLERFCAENSGIIFQYLYNGSLVATDLCIMNTDQLIILKTTYDETIDSTSPAMLMREDSFRYVFENKSSARIEFYGKVMDWHKKWANDSRLMYHSNVYGLFYRVVKQMPNPMMPFACRKKDFKAQE